MIDDTANMEALAAWKKDGGPRPITNPDGILTCILEMWMTDAERAIRDAWLAVEKLGASENLTEAMRHLRDAHFLVVSHVEKKPSA